jgi:hypothetical protein
MDEEILISLLLHCEEVIADEAISLIMLEIASPWRASNDGT